MCYVIDLPDGKTIQTINELESAFGLAVDDYHYYPDTLKEERQPGAVSIRDGCLCQVDREGYLTAVGASWHFIEDYEGDINVLMMPPLSALHFTDLLHRNNT